MDDKVRTIEAARVERERRGDISVASVGSELTAASPIGPADTGAHHQLVVALDELRRERERILAPDAGGGRGTPYKILRTQVLRRLQELGANTLAVLSATKGDGKTLTAINLAIAIAADFGHRALLVDLDLRNPSVHQRLGIEPQVGIEDCLERRRPAHEAMIKLAGYERLMVLPARAPLEHSSELIATARMGELIEDLRAQYVNRILVFDLPPVLLTDDALAFLRHVQAGLFVVAEGKTAREDVTRSLSLLSNLPIVGTVLNRSRYGDGAYYTQS
jgi:protein-tyrosine kinase